VKEVEAAEAITHLQSQLAEQKTMNVHLDRKLSDMAQQRSKAMETLNNEMVILKQAKEELESDVREQSAKLQERHATISVLTRKNTLLEQRERTIQSQLDNALEDLRRAKEEQEKTLAALDREMNRQRTNREDDDINFQKRWATLQKDLSDAEAKLLAQKEQTAEVERILEERTQLLGSMVTHNKETADEKDTAFARISVLEETLACLREEKEAIDHELTQVRALQQKREDQLLEKIHDEQHLREVAEADLEAVRSKLSSIRRGSKDADELEKENMVLKDKVRRQEDYLKRKLQKDKVLRERNSKNVTATPSRRIPSPKILGEHKSRNILATPSRSRIASPTKRRPVPSTIGGSTTKSLTTLSETSSFPDEWDI
jgi:chromosome segregation ATPase